MDVTEALKQYYKEDVPFDDERSKAAYFFFSEGRGKAYEEIEEERKQYITNLIDNYKKGMEAGYKKALKSIKTADCSPVMREFIKGFAKIGNETNFGFGPNLQEE